MLKDHTINAITDTKLYRGGSREYGAGWGNENLPNYLFLKCIRIKLKLVNFYLMIYRLEIKMLPLVTALE